MIFKINKAYAGNMTRISLDMLRTCLRYARTINPGAMLHIDISSVSCLISV
jgi:hypothetical protein